MEINELKILAASIQKMYLENEDVNDIFNILKDVDNKDNIYKALSKKYKIKEKENEFQKVILNFLLSIKNSNINNNFLDYDDIEQKFKNEYNKKENYNFEKMTYPLFLFTEKLYYKLSKDNIQKVYFLAREGQFFKKLFDLYQENIIGPKIESCYLYVSRASTFLGTLENINKENFSSLFTQYPNMSLITFCQNLGFNEKEIKSLEKQINEDFAKDIVDLKNSNIFKKLISNKNFIKLYDEKRIKAKDMFTKYLEQFGESTSGKMALVDVGWKGTIQNNIQKIFPNKEIKGYYLGLVHYDKVYDYVKKDAVLFENTPQKVSKNGYLYNSNRSIFELILLANHGSTLNYVIKNGQVEPVLNTQQKELDLYNKQIKPIQDNILQKFKNIVTILKYGYYDNLKIEKAFNYKFFELMFNPSKKEINEYNSFYMYENFGVMNYSTFNNKNKTSFKNKLKNYRHFRSFIQNDDSWQYLKLHNNNMYFGKIILYLYKKKSFKKNNVI